MTVRRSHLILLGACVAMSCAAATREAGVAAVRTSEFSTAGCLEAAAPACPGFLVESMRYAQDMCREFGSTLRVPEASSIWKLDVNHDGVAEYLFEIGENVYCEGAASMFSCGSLGCPRTLVQRAGEDWRVIGGVFVEPPEALSVLSSGVLRAACPDEPACSEYRFYEWMDDHYEQSYLDVRGHRVEFANSLHGLYPLKVTTELRTEPDAASASVGSYEAQTDVAIVGTSTDGDYFYVSPCNACESGFVERAKVAQP